MVFIFLLFILILIIEYLIDEIIFNKFLWIGFFIVIFLLFLYKSCEIKDKFCVELEIIIMFLGLYLIFLVWNKYLDIFIFKIYILVVFLYLKFEFDKLYSICLYSFENFLCGNSFNFGIFEWKFI